MSINSELEKSKSYLRKARKAIIGRGGEISATAGLKDLPDAIYNIPADVSLVFQTDEDVAFRKIVPVGAEEYAQIARIGGMTYKSKNLIPSPYANGTQTQNGVTWTPNEDGSINANGTQTVSSSYAIVNFAEPLLLNGTYSASIGSALPSGCSLYLAFDDALGNVEIIKSSSASGSATITNRYCKSVRIWVEKDVVFNNVTFYPMLNIGSTVAEFEARYEGLRDTKVTALESEGANLLPRATQNRRTINGVTFTVQDDNSILVNGTATATANFEILRGYMGEYFALEKDETYTLSGCPEGGSIDSYRLIIQSLDYNQSFTEYGSGYTEIAKKDKYYAFIRISAGYTANNLVFKPMLNRGSTVLPYSPYGTIVDTLTIPEAVQSLDGYGQGNPDNTEEYNYIDFERKKFIAYGCIVDGVWVAYEEPRETDISAYLTDNFIKVEGGGEIVFENDYEYDAPSTINYITKVGG